jgi:hypothetical protein
VLFSTPTFSLGALSGSKFLPITSRRPPPSIKGCPLPPSLPL